MGEGKVKGKAIRAGTVLIPADFLRLMLGLSDEHEVLSVYQGPGRRRNIAFVVTGPLMPERAEKEEAPFVRMTMENQDSPARVISAEVVEE